MIHLELLQDLLMPVMTIEPLELSECDCFDKCAFYLINGNNIILYSY